MQNIQIISNLNVSFPCCFFVSTTVNQFKAILESSGYECYTKDDDLCIKRDGHVIETLPLSVIQQHCQTSESDEKRRKQLRAILLKYRDMTADKEELRTMMKQKFGIDLVFHGSKDKPYGYTIIDHQNKTVLKGGEVLKLKELLQFQPKEAHPELAHQAAESHGHRTPITRQQPSESTHLRKPTITKEGSRDQNREWEVGHNTRYNDIDDENHLKR